MRFRGEALPANEPLSVSREDCAPRLCHHTDADAK